VKVTAQSMDVMNSPVDVFLQCTEDAIYIGRVNTSLACTVTFFLGRVNTSLACTVMFFGTG